MWWSERQRATDEAMRNPRPGDRFCECYSFWVYVVARAGDVVTTMEANPPCTFPYDARVVRYTLEELREHFGYRGIPGYWVTLVDRDNDVTGWLEYGSEPTQEQVEYAEQLVRAGR